MARDEMLKRMEEIENRRFRLAMIDFWKGEDFELDRKLFKEYLDLKKKVEEIEKNA